ncbi:hypothetical protein MRS75_24750, partial [Rhizobiaceae bacterium n36]|nr:hypothetical protein [Fererhizobium litorale]
MEFAIFSFDWLGKPVWMWLTFLSIVIALLVFDLGVLHRDNREIEVRESLLLSTMYIGVNRHPKLTPYRRPILTP